MSQSIRVAIAAVALVAVAATAEAQDRTPVTECDTLAAHPADPNKVAPGAQWDTMGDGRAAVYACEAATKQYPQSLRLRFQLARALLRAKRSDDAIPMLMDVADKGYKIAFSNLGGMYLFDRNQPNEALKWFERGVKAGDEASEYHLAEMYMDGLGVPQSMAQAIRLFSPSAERNTAVSIYKIGDIYARGDHTVARDYTKALQYLQRAAGLGFARAQNDIGYMLEQGMGLPKNLAEAVKWYRVAGEQGWGQSQVNLGRLYENGTGVPKDLKEAYYWYRLAGNSRIDRDRNAGRAKMDELRKRIDSSALAEVDGRVNAWKVLKPEETVAMLPSPVDPNYVPPTQTAAVDKGYAPPPSAASPAKGKTAPAKPAADTVDKGYVPPPAEPAKGPAKSDPGKSDVDTAYVPPAVIEIETMDARYQVLKSGNVRAMPDTGAPAVGKVDAGREVAVTGKVKGQGWYAIELDGKRAYVSSVLLAAKPVPKEALPAAVAAAPPAPAPAVVATTPVAATPAAAAARDDIATLLAGIEFGKYHALVIGNNAYRHMPKLQSPRNDARALSAMLTKEFGFKVTVINDATRADVIAAFSRLRASLTENDNLLVYYAGHGIIDDTTQRGYWLPVDAEEKVPTNWVSNADISDMVRAIEAKHVMVVADACYSGTLMRDTTARIDTARDRQVWLRRITSKRARTVLASGGIEPVLDSGGGEHSVFAKAFLAALGDSGDIIDAVTLFDKLRRPVVLNSDQTPRYADIRNAGHDGGEFVFVRKKPGGN